jgi:hypothetical protein
VVRSSSTLAEKTDRNPAGKNSRALIEAAVVQAAREHGREVESPQEAFAEMIGVQAGIALDDSKPAQAIAAVRLIAKEAQLSGQDDSEEADQPWFVLGRQLAEQVLALIEEELARRERV